MEAKHFYNTVGTNLLSLESIQNVNAQIAQLRKICEEESISHDELCSLSLAMARLVEVSNGYQWRLFPSTVLEKPHMTENPDLQATLKQIEPKHSGILYRICCALRADTRLLFKLLALIGFFAFLIFLVIRYS